MDNNDYRTYEDYRKDMEDGNIVIVFDKYEVAPGAMGTPEFEIDKEVYKMFLKEEYK